MVALLSVVPLGAAQLFQYPQAPLSVSSRTVAQPLALSPALAQGPLPPTYFATAADEYPSASSSSTFVAAGIAAVGLAVTLSTRKAKPMVFLAVDGKDDEPEDDVELAALAVEGKLDVNVEQTAAELAAKLKSAEKALDPASQGVPSAAPGDDSFMALRGPPRRTYQRGRPVRIFNKGLSLLNDAMFNKGTAFSDSERERLGLRGLLPPRVQSVEDQFRRMMKLVGKFKDVNSGVTDDERVEYWRELTAIKGRSRVLYYKVLMENFQKLCGIVYTPTIGLICQRWSQPVFKSGLHKEMYLSIKDKGEMAALIYNYPYNDVDLVIVTDGSRVLGLGDLGVNGAGFDPARILPVALDLGTNNEKLRNNPEYLGTPVEKPTGEEYYELVDEFIQ